MLAKDFEDMDEKPLAIATIAQTLTDLIPCTGANFHEIHLSTFDLKKVAEKMSNNTLACTDGSTIWFEEGFLKETLVKLGNPTIRDSARLQLQFTLAHEIFHIREKLRYPYRWEHRKDFIEDTETWIADRAELAAEMFALAYIRQKAKPRFSFEFIQELMEIWNRITLIKYYKKERKRKHY